MNTSRYVAMRGSWLLGIAPTWVLGDSARRRSIDLFTSSRKFQPQLSAAGAARSIHWSARASTNDCFDETRSSASGRKWSFVLSSHLLADRSPNVVPWMGTDYGHERLLVASLHRGGHANSRIGNVLQPFNAMALTCKSYLF